MIEIRNKRIVIDGEPRIILCGEIHYFRLDPEDWQDRIDKLKAAGCNAVASYVPWLCHEPAEGEFDFTGRTHPRLNLVRFIDLCRENGLYFFVRPGPFIMAEMKNEGLPYWVYEKHPEIVPVGWDGRPAPTKTVDYLAPGFLEASRNWYRAVMGVIAPRLYTKGGNIIAVQLDNEIGMLSWVSNSPDLTEHVLGDFAAWLKERYSAAELARRYPFDADDADARRIGIRSPQESFAPQLMRDLGYYMRSRFARYVAILRSYAEECGVRDVPFVVNIHGTSGGRGFTYPIGISQLYEAYTQSPGYLSGSDIYFGDLTMETFQDLYLINAFMDAVHTPDQPLTSVEFNCGDGNFGETLGGRYDPSAADFKLRMCIVQGNRLINYYLMAGGTNPRLPVPVGDGNDRIAFTGERHGFAAPISPEGELNYTFPRMARGNRAVMAAAEKLARMDEERDGVRFAFIPDYYMTESRYPESEAMSEIVRNLEANRAYGAWEIMGRAMLLAGYRFGAADIQNKPLDPRDTPALALPSARYMHGDIQRKLADYVRAGGKLLVYGELPTYDMCAEPCTTLIDALGVKVTGELRATQEFHLSIVADHWAATRPEVRSGRAQTFDCGRHTPILRICGSGEVCGFDAEVGAGRAIVIGCAYRCDIALFRTALERLGVRAGLTHDAAVHGIFMTSTASAEGERFLHLLNLDGLDKTLHVLENGRPLFDGRELLLQSKDGVMLPLNVTFGGIKIVYATAEIVGAADDRLEFRLTQPADVIVLETARRLIPDADFTIQREGEGGRILITSKKHAKVDDRLTLRFV
jgi:beta-galactosidase